MGIFVKDPSAIASGLPGHFVLVDLRMITIADGVGQNAFQVLTLNDHVDHAVC